MASVVEAACNEVLRRTGGAGFPVFCYSPLSGSAALQLNGVIRGVERACPTALVYHGMSKERCSEAEVDEWLRKRRIGEEMRCLICDNNAIRGWEASHLLVVALQELALENLVMRTMGYCALVKK